MKKTIILLLSVAFLASCSAGKLTVQVSNSLKTDRENEIVELSKNSIWSKLNLTPHDKIIVLDSKSTQVAYQIATNFDNHEDSLLIFPVTVKANSASAYTIKKGKPEIFTSKVAGRLVPERKDDFNWENDRIAFRMYGPALQAGGEVSSGIDIWAKRTDKLVADQWYADELAGKKTYHTDGGEGLDFYKVGPTLGAGAAAPYVDSKIRFSKNFKDYVILDKGPLRIMFRLNYDWFPAGTTGDVRSSRIISLDAGSRLNKIRQMHEFKAVSMPVAAGIVLRNSPDEKIFVSENKTCFAHAEPNDSANGVLYQAVVGTLPFTSVETKQNHLLGVQTVKPLEPFTYYTGGGWSKFGFETFESWIKYVQDFSGKIQTPLTITIK